MISVVSYHMVSAGQFLPMETVDTRSQELDLIEGALEITVDGVPVVDTTMWDYIFPLWAYLAQATQDLRETGEGSLNFPDQPLRFTLRRVGNGVRLGLHGRGTDRTVVAKEPEFLQALRARGTEFFALMREHHPNDRELIDDCVAALLRDPEGSDLSDVPWEKRLDERQVAAFRHVERLLGGRMSPAEREELTRVVAGRKGTFDEYVECLIDAWRR